MKLIFGSSGRFRDGF